MRKLALIAASLLLAVRVPAMAGDVSQPLTPSWAGFYVGVNGGWYQNINRSVSNTGTDTGPLGLGTFLAVGAFPAKTGLGYSGGLGGVTGGYNWQFAPMWLVGIEADIDGISAGTSTSFSTPGNFRGIGNAPFALGFSRSSNFSATLRPRIGVLPVPQLLLYATGGLAVGEDGFTASFTCPVCATPTFTSRTVSAWAPGLIAGAGAEWQITPSWSVKAEYQRLFYPNLVTGINYLYGTNISTLRSSIPIEDNVVKVGINYHF